MQKKRESLRHNIIFTIFCCYTIPVAILVSLYARNIPLGTNWFNFLIGLSIALAGTFFFYYKMTKWTFPVSLPEPVVEAAAVAPVVPPSQDVLEEHRQEKLALEEAIEDLKEKWHEKKTESERIQADWDSYRIESEEQLKKKDALLTEYAQTVNDLRGTMGQKQDQIEKLQESINDLSYDLDTLIKLSKYEGEPESPAPQKEVEKPPKQELKPAPKTRIKDLAQANQQLKKCINNAQKLSSSQFSSSRYPLDNTALDKRRLFDMFKSESASMVILYSMKEKQLLFANDVCRTWLGWAPEKFVQDFSSIVLRGKPEWDLALASLIHQTEAQCHIAVETEEGDEILFQCVLGVIPTGIFKNHAVGILYEVI